jgi:hypothetical protein
MHLSSAASLRSAFLAAQPQSEHACATTPALSRHSRTSIIEVADARRQFAQGQTSIHALTNHLFKEGFEASSKVDLMVGRELPYLRIPIQWRIFKPMPMS